VTLSSFRSVQTTILYEKTATCGLSLFVSVLWLKWYVTQSLIEIHEQARKGEITVERGKEELIAYMHWRTGEKKLDAYNHCFQPANHATVQTNIFKKLRGAQTKQSQTKKRRMAKRTSVQSSPPRQQLAAQAEEQPQDSTALYAFLVGTGGYTDELIADLLITD
jgi:hypothetical protein